MNHFNQMKRFVGISKPISNIECEITLSASKSITNRLLVLNSKVGGLLRLHNISFADDTLLIIDALQDSKKEVNLKNAGTAMRFLTALFASQNGKEIILSCDERMKSRPIQPLVNALREIGAHIEYIEMEGFPPLKISGRNLIGQKIYVDSNQSSQFISALMLIAPFVKNGLEISFDEKMHSVDYVYLTADVMRDAGFQVNFKDVIIKIEEQKNIPSEIYIESDWSSAAFWFEIVALSDNSYVKLKNLSLKSSQGDKVVAKMFTELGLLDLSDLHTDLALHSKDFSDNISNESGFMWNFDLNNCPDLAPALAVTLAAKNIEANLSGLRNLVHKESNRLMSVCENLIKVGFNLTYDSNSIYIRKVQNELNSNIIIDTHNDHRIAMAFAPLALITDKITIENPGAVVKSYPSFWKDLEKAGFILIYFD